MSSNAMIVEGEEEEEEEIATPIVPKAIFPAAGVVAASSTSNLGFADASSSSSKEREGASGFVAAPTASAPETHYHEHQGGHVFAHVPPHFAPATSRQVRLRDLTDQWVQGHEAFWEKFATDVTKALTQTKAALGKTLTSTQEAAQNLIAYQERLAEFSKK